MTRVTVLMTHYRSEDTLPTAIASILGQSLADLTLLLADDHSPDDAWLDAVAPFRNDPRLRIFRSDRNVGTYRLKNALLGLVSSPYVAFQDADDVSLPGRLLAQLSTCERTGAGVVGSGFYVVDEAGIRIGRRRMPRWANFWMRLGKSFVALHPTTLVKRTLFDRLGGFDGTTRVGADSDFLWRAAWCCRIVNIQAALYEYRQHPRSLTAAPETGFGSPVRRGYAEAAVARERARRFAVRSGAAPELSVSLSDLVFRIEEIGGQGRLLAMGGRTQGCREPFWE